MQGLGTPSSFCFWSGIFFIIIATILFYSMLGEVNGKRSTQERIGMLFVNTRFFEIVRIHRQLFPASKKYLLMYTSVALGFSLVLWSVLGFRPN
jgi:uncharacterized membrane protein (DUF106 family)